MEKNLFLAVMAALILLAAIPAAEAAVSLGSVQDKYSAEVVQGQETGFVVFLFNIHQNETVRVSLDSEYPFGLGVSISPRTLNVPYLPPGTPLQEGYSVLSTSEGNIMVKTVSVSVSTTSNTAPGEYDIKVIAATESSGGTLAVSQGRAFRFRVNVKEYQYEEPDQEEEIVHEEPVEVQEAPKEPLVGDEETEDVTDAGGKSTFTRQVEEVSDTINRMTGSVINNPVISPVVIIIVLMAGIYLKKSDRI